MEIKRCSKCTHFIPQYPTHIGYYGVCDNAPLWVIHESDWCINGWFKLKTN